MSGCVTHAIPSTSIQEASAPVEGVPCRCFCPSLDLQYTGSPWLGAVLPRPRLWIGTPVHGQVAFGSPGGLKRREPRKFSSSLHMAQRTPLDFMIGRQQTVENGVRHHSREKVRKEEAISCAKA